MQRWSPGVRANVRGSAFFASVAGAVAERSIGTVNKAVKTSVAAVVPAHNEEKRIGRVIEALLQSNTIDHVIVVNDGSTDNTSSVAGAYAPGITVLDLPKNQGKGGAMLRGAHAADSDVLLFLDADLIGLTPKHVDDLVAPILAGHADMAVGQFKGGHWLTDLAQLLVPYISGQRAIRRGLFLQVPDLDRVGYGIEMAITFHVKYLRKPVKSVTLRGVTHPMKEEKLGYFRGSFARARMYGQMLRFGLRYALRRKRKISR